jgi:hypothetical protein
MNGAKEYLHSDELNEWDTVFDPGGKQEYTEEQLIRFAEMWAKVNLLKELTNIEDESDSVSSYMYSIKHMLIELRK